ncbi:MAG: PDZ domain-containing protein [Comamonadaceae bacterium]|nr:MAG: PDZ domain-containing protein [Comamonadaceae bacterium]
MGAGRRVAQRAAVHDAAGAHGALTTMRRRCFRGAQAWRWLATGAVLAMTCGLGSSPAWRGSATCGAQQSGPGAESGFAAAAGRSALAVVDVIVLRKPWSQEDDAAGLDYFPPLAGAAAPGGAALVRSGSSGFVIESDGHLVASAHAVREAHEIWVLTADGRRHPAEVVGFDRRTDVALLKIQASGLATVAIDPASRLCPGDRVAAIGSPFGFDRSVTAGVVSASPRFLPGSGGIPWIQTDVALNPGSSGGPLLNPAGAVVGMNSMIYSASGIYVGVSFAIPIDRVLRVVAALRAGGRADVGGIGAELQPVSAELAMAFGLERPRGALVAQVDPQGPAAKAGLRSGDILLAIGGIDLEPDSDVDGLIGGLLSQGPVAVRFWRGMRVHAGSIAAATALPGAAAAPSAPRREESRLGLDFAPPAAAGGEPAGVMVDAASGSALLAGIEPGDRIVAVNGAQVANVADFDAALLALNQRQVVALLIQRAGVSVYLPVRRRDR